jgi:F-type H+-transporting ATPase subunit delta
MINSVTGYALALFDIGKENNKLKKFKNDSKLVISLLEENPRYIQLLSTHNVEVDKKLAIHKETFDKQINKMIFNFIAILIERNKISHLIPSLKKLINFINEELDIHEGVVYSIKPLEEAIIKKISIKTSKMLKMKISLINKIDSSLLSGIRVEVGDQVIDNSILTKLQKLKYELLEESRVN